MLNDADLWGAILTNASLGSADLSRAYLSGANLKDADLSHAIFEDAVIRCSANTYCTNFKGATNITPQQIKKSRNWKQACYDPDFRIELGLPPENPKHCAGDEPKK